jgi:hypothetical protein
MDLSKKYGAPPASGYFTNLLEELELVGEHVEKERAARGDVVRLTRNPSELALAVQQNKLALVHAVEGGFHLGDTDDQVIANIKTLAERGVAYITVRTCSGGRWLPTLRHCRFSRTTSTGNSFRSVGQA